MGLNMSARLLFLLVECPCVATAFQIFDIHKYIYKEVKIDCYAEDIKRHIFQHHLREPSSSRGKEHAMWFPQTREHSLDRLNNYNLKVTLEFYIGFDVCG
jgi:hypothetical protein